MGVRYLVPAMVECPYENNCNKRSYNKCTRCRQNKVALEKHKKEKSKKNWFKSL